MSGAFHAIPVNFTASGAVQSNNTRSRSASVVSLASYVDRTPKEIRTMLSAVSVASKSERQKIVTLVRELVAIRHLFAANASEKADQRLIFDWKKPIGNIRFTHTGVARLLREISPRIAADEHRVAFIKNYVNNQGVCKNIETGLRDSLLTPDMASLAPCDLPRKQVLSFLRNCYWEVLNLTGADLRNNYFRGVQWPGAILHKTILIGCNLRHSNLAQAMMVEAVADHADLGHANMSKVNGRKASLIKAKSYETTIKDADFTEARIEYAEGLRFDQGATFADARLTDVKAGWDLNDNPLLANEPEAVAHQLKSLSSIHSRHDGLHNEIVWKLLNKIDRKTFKLSECPVVTDVLLKQVRCWPHKDIESFINNVMLPQLFMHWNIEPAGDSALMGYVMHYLSVKKPALDWVQHCGAVSQLQLHAIQQQQKEEAEVLSAMVEAHLGIAPLAKAMAEESGIEPFEKCSIFMGPNLDRAIIYPNSHLAAMEAGRGSPYEEGRYFVRNETGAFVRDVLRDLDTIKICQVPLKPYNIDALPPAGAEKMLSYIFSGSEFKDMIIHALTCKTLPPVEEDEAYMLGFMSIDVRMGAQLSKFIAVHGEPYIHPQQCERLYKILIAAIPDTPELKALGGNGSEDEDAKNIARMLYCLGTLFVRSSALFGTGRASPGSLRNFARACLNASHSYDASLLDRRTSSAMSSILEGDVGHSLQCSNDITNTILESIRIKIRVRNDMALEACFKAIYPQAGL